MLDDKTRYDNLREAALRYERANVRWSPEVVFPASSGYGPAPMDVDINKVNKGKGKEKGKQGKSKAKNGGKSNKGKSKSKGGKSSYNKGKGRGDKGKGKGGKLESGKGSWNWSNSNKDPNRCNNCGGYNHWARDCPNKSVNLLQNADQTSADKSQQAQTQQNTATATRGSGGGHGGQQQQATGVRRVHFDFDDDANFDTVIYDMCADEDFLDDANDIGLQIYRVGMSNMTMSTCEFDFDRAFDIIAEQTVADTACAIRGVRGKQGKVSDELILDSGADITCLPMSWSNSGIGTEVRGDVLIQDAQSNQMPCGGMCNATWEFLDAFKVTPDLNQALHDEPVILNVRDKAVFSSVAQPLLAVGKMLRNDWELRRIPDEGLCIVHPTDCIAVPVRFRGESMVANAIVRHVLDAGTQQELDVRGVHGSDYLEVRVNSELEQLSYGWQVISNNCAAWKGLTTEMDESTVSFPASSGYKFQTLLVNFKYAWSLCEMCEHHPNIEMLKEYHRFHREAIVILSKRSLSADEMGFSCMEGEFEFPVRSKSSSGDDVIASPDQQASAQDASDDMEIPNLGDGELRPGVDERDEDIVGIPPDVQGAEIPNKPSHLDLSPNRVMVEGIELTEESLPKGGSEKRCFKRLVEYVSKQHLEMVDQLLEQNKMDCERRPKEIAIHKTPSVAEQRLHELTHTPYQPWCTACSMMRSRDNKHSDSEGPGRRAIPTVSFDFCFTGLTDAAKPDDNEKLTCLVAKCSATGCIQAIPTCEKGGANLKFLALELNRFIQLLGHPEVTLKCDCEPTVLKIQQVDQLQ